VTQTFETFEAYGGVIADSDKEAKELVTDFLKSGATKIRRAGTLALLQLVSAALLSVLIIITGFPFLLGFSISLIILAIWSILRSWVSAEEAMKETVAFSLLISMFTEGMQKPEGS
jgi:hypothetical protein